jgi:hypothetical protein
MSINDFEKRMEEKHPWLYHLFGLGMMVVLIALFMILIYGFGG